MILPDVNVLIYAFRADSPDHAMYKDWLETNINASGPYGISPQVLSSLVRICTHSKIYKQPSELNETLQFCGVLLESPNATVIQPQDRHWSIFESLCISSRTRGNFVQDAWLAALAIESGCEWITTDGDFARFEGLVHRKPF